MSCSAVSLLRELANRMGELSIIRSSAIGTASQVVSDELDQYIPQTTQNMAAWIYCTEGVNAGYERRARAYAPSADTLTLHTAFPHATESGVEYELHARTQRARKLEALNSAIGQLGLYWPRDVIDTSLVGIDRQHEYPLSSGTNWASVTDVQLQHLTDENPYQQTGASQFTAATPSYASIASNASLLTGDADQWFAGWFYLDSLGVGKTLLAKSDTAGTGGSYRITAAGSNVLRFELTNDGTNVGRVELNYSSAPLVTGRWYFFFAYYDAVNNLMGLILDDRSAVTIAQTGGAFANTTDFRLGARSTSGVIAAPHNGRLETVALGKSPPGGIAVLAPTLAARLYNDGVPVRYADLTSFEKTAWGLVSWWRGDEATGADRDDSHGTNHLTSTNVAAIAGVVPVFDASVPLYPYDDVRDLNWDIRREMSSSGAEVWTLVFGDQPTPGNIIRVTGTAFFSELVFDADVLPTGGLWEGAALDWIYDWAKYRLLDETVERQPGGQAERYRQRAVDKLQQAKQDVLLLMKPKGGNRIVTPWSRSTGRRGGINLAEFNIMGLARDFS